MGPRCHATLKYTLSYSAYSTRSTAAARNPPKKSTPLGMFKNHRFSTRLKMLSPLGLFKKPQFLFQSHFFFNQLEKFASLDTRTGTKRRKKILTSWHKRCSPSGPVGRFLSPCWRRVSLRVRENALLLKLVRPEFRREGHGMEEESVSTSVSRGLVVTSNMCVRKSIRRFWQGTPAIKSPFSSSKPDKIREDEGAFGVNHAVALH